MSVHPEQSSAVAHFFGGPKDGVNLEVQEASYEIYFAGLREVSFFSDPDAIVSVRDIVYRRRGPALSGHAYYDYAGER